MDISNISRISRVAGNYSIDTYSKLPDNSVNSTKSLSVVIKDFIDRGTTTQSQLDAISSILQSIYESMANTINNMVMTPEERKALEEKQALVKKTEKMLKQHELEEKELKIILDMIIADENKKWLDEKYIEHIERYA